MRKITKLTVGIWMLLVIFLVGVKPVFAANSLRPTIPDNHGWDEWRTVKEPTCTEDGLERIDCKYCDLFAEAVLPALGHDEHVETVEPTCSEDGYELTTCSRCDYEKRVIKPAIGHDWGQWQIIKEPTTKEPGQSIRVCKHDETHIQTQEIPAFSMKVDAKIDVISKVNEAMGLEKTVIQSSKAKRKNTETLQKEQGTKAETKTKKTKYVSSSSKTAKQVQTASIVRKQETKVPLLSNILNVALPMMCMLVLIVGGILIYPYYQLFHWVRIKKKEAIRKIFGGK